MLTLSPKLHFQKVTPAAAEELYKAVRTSWMNAAIISSMAEVAYDNATAEQLQGARKFIKAFLNLAEEVDYAPKDLLPSKELVGQLPAQKIKTQPERED